LLRHFPPPRLDIDVRWTAVCFAHAGAGATPFAAWRRYLPDWIDLYALVAPGREELLQETALPSLEALVATALPAIAELPKRLVLIGHSYGAWIALETAHLLVTNGRPVDHLVILAAAPPGHAPLPRIDDDRDIEALLARLGADTSRLAHPAFRDMFFPALRADLAAQIAYRPQHRDRLRSPLTVLYGEEDASIAYEDAQAWCEWCSEDCFVGSVPGGHFFPRTSPASTIDMIVGRLSHAPP